MRRVFVLVLLAAACVPRVIYQEGEINPMPPEVQRVNTRMLDAMGGAKAWSQARYFEFDYIVMEDGKPVGPPRSHRWDRSSGRYRLREVRLGDTVVAIGNVNTLKGRAWVNGKEMPGSFGDSLFATAYARFFNDTYWLVMPYKWADAGVHTQYLGAHKDEKGVEWEMVKLMYDLVGLAPETEYLAFINPQTGIMERVYYFAHAGAAPIVYDWKNWSQFGPIKLATERVPVDGATIEFRNLKVATKPPKDAFAPLPEPGK